MSLVMTFAEIGAHEIGLVGGKALSLGRLTQANMPVPPGFVITTAAYKDAENNDINIELEEVIFKAFDDLDVEYVAVRSSAIAEDSTTASWAGQFESFLNVDRHNLIESIKSCWDSASSDLVKSYAEGQQVGEDQLALAVVVQKMVISDVSGVAFSVNPISKNNNEIMTEAIYGLGELLVQGMVTPDNYIVQKSDLEILKKTIKSKNKMLIFQNGDNKELDVPQSKVNDSCLDDEQIIMLAELVIEIEKYYGAPQDIEWALENGKIFIVQSRPITTI